jgi:hypothetical protein
VGFPGEEYNFSFTDVDFHDDNNSIKFNSILYYLYAESTAKRPITDTAQFRSRYLHYRQTQITG